MDKNLKLEEKIRIETSANSLWDAIIDPQKIKLYFYGTEVVSDWKIGSIITFSGEWQNTAYHDKGVILDIQENHLLKYDYWSSFWGEEYSDSDRSVITYTLNALGDDLTELTITQQGFNDKTSLEHSVQSWKGILNNIKELLEQ